MHRLAHDLAWAVVAIASNSNAMTFMVQAVLSAGINGGVEVDCCDRNGRFQKNMAITAIANIISQTANRGTKTCILDSRARPRAAA